MPSPRLTVTSSPTILRYGRRPAPFYVLYCDTRARAGHHATWVDQDASYVFRDAETSADARQIADSVSTWAEDVRVFERTDMRDVTPDDEPLRGQLWAFEERLLTGTDGVPASLENR